MAVELTGELLAVTTQHVNAGTSSDGARSWDAYDSTKLVVFDAGRVLEARVGKDFPSAELAKLHSVTSKGERPHVRLSVFVTGKGGIYATDILAAGVPA